MRIAASVCCLLAGVLAIHVQGSRSAENATTIFKCTIDGVATFSDRPCGQDAQAQTLDAAAINTYAPSSRAAITPSPAVKAGSKPSREDRSEAKRRDSCARYARSLKEIRSKMRSGYTAKEGERLRAREEKLKYSQREARCS